MCFASLTKYGFHNYLLQMAIKDVGSLEKCIVCNKIEHDMKLHTP